MGSEGENDLEIKKETREGHMLEGMGGSGDLPAEGGKSWQT